MADERPSTPADAPRTNLWRWDNKRKFQRIFTRQAVKSYVYLSFGMGVVALALPILLLLVGVDGPHYSISHYYYAGDSARNILVGSLWATGVFLFLFHGLSDWENWILNVAGMAAISVAMNPMAKDQCDGSTPGVHGASAIVFFGCLAVVAIFFSKGRVGYIIYPPKRRFFTAAYNVAGIAMIATIAIIAAVKLTGIAKCDTSWIFWAETFGIWAFSFYWFVKTHEYRLLLRI
jgi:hypothetical protein